MNTKNKRFRLVSIAGLLILSVYPLWGGARMVYYSIANGAIEPEQYVRYVVPYTAICISLLWFAAMQPIFAKIASPGGNLPEDRIGSRDLTEKDRRSGSVRKRLAFPLGLLTAYSVFFAVESLLERIQIRVSGMTLIDPSMMTPVADDAILTADAWQAALCSISPIVRQQSMAYEVQDRLVYVAGDSLYKIHYYLISLILISMVCGLIYGIATMYRYNDFAKIKLMRLRGGSTAALVALCIFANTTAFFRQAGLVQTPLASILTGLFFVILGASAGVYVGSFLMSPRNGNAEAAGSNRLGSEPLPQAEQYKGKKLRKKSSLLAVGVPVFVSVCATLLMYIGEAAMMRGRVYILGAGWFFRPLIKSLAPVDVLIIILSGAVTWLILSIARKNDNRTGKRAIVTVVAACAAIAIAGPVIAAIFGKLPGGASPGGASPNAVVDDIYGCYVFDANLYTHPLSSYMAFGGTPFVYGFDRGEAIFADIGSGDAQRYAVDYYNKPVGADEFTSKHDGPLSTIFTPPGLTGYIDRYLLAVISDTGGVKFGLYRMDNEMWLVEFRSLGVWTIYRIRNTEETTLDDLRRVFEFNESHRLSALVLPDGTYANQITLKDVFTLARKGDKLNLSDFEPFHYQLAGRDFSVRRYDVIGADTIFVTVSGDGTLAAAELWSRRTVDMSNTVDLRDGFAAVTEYLNPLKLLIDIKIEDPHGGEDVPEMFFEDDYFRSECRYYLNSRRADSIFVVFENGERMPIRLALQERRVTVENLVAAGLFNVTMAPIDNPLGGEFVTLHHMYRFNLNGEAFYPSKSFMYVVFDGGFSVYYDIDELAQILGWYGYENEAEALLKSVAPVDIFCIAAGNYVRDEVLSEAGIASAVGWEFSSHTPVGFMVG